MELYERGVDDGYHGREIDVEYAWDRDYITGYYVGQDDAKKASK